MDVVKLIRGVKCREPLWDRKHAYYHDRTVTMALWDDVAFSLGVDSETVRTKWKGLRDTFRGELRKLHRTMIGGKPRKSTNWEYFDEMLFVKEQIYSNKRHLEELMNHSKKAMTTHPLNGIGSTTNTDLAKAPSSNGTRDYQNESSSTVSDEDDSRPVSSSNHHSDDSSTQSSSCDDVDGLDLTTTARRPTQPQRTSLADSEEAKIVRDQTEVPVSPRKTHRDVEDDEDFNFLMSLLPQLRCLPTTRNLLVRLKMQEVLYNEMMAVQNFYS